MIYLIVGNSGSGKTTQAKLLQDKNNFSKITTYTTRPIRIGEKNNIDYHFIDKDTFKTLEKENKLLGIAKFANNYYAIPKEELEKYKDSKKNCVLVIELEGVKEIKKEFNAICIYLKIDENQMIKRMTLRNECQEILKNRLKEIQDYTPYSDFIIDAEKSVREVYKEILNIIK